MRHSVILIPSLSPEPKLVSYVEELMGQGFSHIIVVNDGSAKEYDPVYARLAEMGCIVLRHAVNYGKGRALKNGFNEFLNRFGTQGTVRSVITVDSDGQHLVGDVVSMDERMADAGERRLFLGVRNFDKAQVPLKSKFGNKVTCFFFRLLYGAKVSDTQTGLRGIPKGCVSCFLALKGERFEYETSMLVAAVKNRIALEEMAIETVYLEGNSGTHFRPLQDSAAIYGILLGGFLKYIFSSLSASLLDIGIFSLLSLWMSGTKGIWAATALARLLSSLYNYSVNRKVVFASDQGAKSSLWRYYVLCIAQAACSAALVSGIVGRLAVSKTWCKAVVDTFLFFISYQIQRRFVFGRKGNDK